MVDGADLTWYEEWYILLRPKTGTRNMILMIRVDQDTWYPKGQVDFVEAPTREGCSLDDTLITNTEDET